MIGVRAISIYDSSGTVYQFDGQYIEPSGDPFTKNQIGIGRSTRYDYTLSFAHNNENLHLSLLQDSNLKELNWRGAVAYLDGFLVWDSDSWMEVSERSTSDPEAGLYPYKITLRRTGNWSIAQASNLVAAWQLAQGNGVFVDSDSSGVADGFTSTFAANSFSGGQQLTYGSGTDEFYIDITFPVAGISLSGGFTHSAVFGDSLIRLIDKDYSGTTGSSASKAVVTTGTNTASITTASDVYKLRLSVEMNSSASITVNTPIVS